MRYNINQKTRCFLSVFYDAERCRKFKKHVYTPYKLCYWLLLEPFSNIPYVYIKNQHAQKPEYIGYRAALYRCCISPLYKYKVLFKSTYKNIRMGENICCYKKSKRISVGKKNLEKIARIKENSFKAIGHRGFSDIISSKFNQNTCRCVQTIRNSIFRSDLYILLPELVKSKIHSLKRLKVIFRGILDLKLSSFSNDPKKIMEIDNIKSSKFNQNSRRCTQTTRNSVFRRVLNISLPYSINSKLCNLKCFISIFKGISFVDHHPTSKKQLNLNKGYQLSLNHILSQNNTRLQSIHSLKGEKLC